MLGIVKAILFTSIVQLKANNLVQQRQVKSLVPRSFPSAHATSTLPTGASLHRTAPSKHLRERRISPSLVARAEGLEAAAQVVTTVRTVDTTRLFTSLAGGAVGLLALSIALEDQFPAIKKSKELLRTQRERYTQELEAEAAATAKKAAELAAERRAAADEKKALPKDDQARQEAVADGIAEATRKFAESAESSSTDSASESKAAEPDQKPAQLSVRTPPNIISTPVALLLGLFVGCAATLSALRFRCNVKALSGAAAHSCH
eukprot:gnl/TRDRNA2_/TRDRNA2_170731_c0_seq2.p1 gnl/TRDRNA2_/TRDRNA2_170731_c0~~gnl/TRDRNA2_/TRDRNA2_170731_c0_seq2.p1  ORF type:complete len:262 (+),score=51.48 gnl/TRDRNA2_/TRDRNA2_170731_c0_seq2:101-886(+)